MSWRFWLFVILGGLALAVVITASERSWARYAAAHHCVPTGENRFAGLILVVQGDGTSIPVSMYEYRWNCADGVVWR